MKKSDLKNYIKSKDAELERERLDLVMGDVSKIMHGRVHPLLFVTASHPKPQLFGSCVLVTSRDRLFVVTAAHVFDELAKIAEYPEVFLFAGGLFKIQGSVFLRADDSAIQGEKIVADAAVLELCEPIPPVLRALSIDEKMTSPPDFKNRYVLAGFPNSRTMEIEGQTLYGLNIVPTMLYGTRRIKSQYVTYEIDGRMIPEASLGFLYYGLEYKDGRYNQAKSIIGMSGGAVSCMNGCPVNVDEPVADNIGLSLTAIIVEKQDRTNYDPPLVVATNIRVHLALIDSIIEDPDGKQYGWSIEAVTNVREFFAS